MRSRSASQTRGRGTRSVALPCSGVYYACTDGVLAGLAAGLLSRPPALARAGPDRHGASLGRLCGAVVFGLLWARQGASAAVGIFAALLMLVLASAWLWLRRAGRIGHDVMTRPALSVNSSSIRWMAFGLACAAGVGAGASLRAARPRPLEPRPDWRRGRSHRAHLLGAPRSVRALRQRRAGTALRPGGHREAAARRRPSAGGAALLRARPLRGWYRECAWGRTNAAAGAVVRLALRCGVHAHARIPLTGPPIRARVSPDGRRAALTVFETGHSYADASFSTRTIVVETASGRPVGGPRGLRRAERTARRSRRSTSISGESRSRATATLLRHAEDRRRSAT